jgi:hypothetical protein
MLEDKSTLLLYYKTDFRQHLPGKNNYTSEKNVYETATFYAVL